MQLCKNTEKMEFEKIRGAEEKHLAKEKPSDMHFGKVSVIEKAGRSS